MAEQLSQEKMWGEVFEALASNLQTRPLVMMVAADVETMRKHLREYRERYVTSAAVDAEIKRLIGEN